MVENIHISAELCCNHMVDFSVAKNMIDTLAKQEKSEQVNIIKFQKRTPKMLLTPEKYNAPHPNPSNSFGQTYGEHREYLEFSIEQHKELKDYVESKGFTYSASAFDRNSLEELLSLNPKMIKIGGSNNTDFGLLKYLASVYDGQIHISLGCITREEEKKIVQSVEDKIGNVVLYACTNAYPAKAGEICLLEIPRIKKEYGKDILAVGFSGHHLGIYQDIGALALGAQYFERHFTLNKNYKGTDQKISLEIQEITELVRALNLVNQDLIYKNGQVLECEQYVRQNLKQITEE